MTRTAVIAQARMGSTRLPGKVLEKLGNRTVVEHCMARVAAIASVDVVCLATSDLPIDDQVAELALGLSGVSVVRGHPTDLLARYQSAAATVSADVILRITCDCPLIDPVVCAALLELREATGATFASNNVRHEWPHGLDCEVFTRQALETAACQATSPYDREHVGPWMRRAAAPDVPHLTGPGTQMARYRWTLDYPEDLEFFRALWPYLPSHRYPTWQEVVAIIDAHPEIAAINAMRIE